ncbi:hypothetical protein [Frigoriglobus tundricola]|uniref:PEP-CTERM protein-sorting domain-containing protein n=1 Tax=Frigoriglobus tundricola TaxID=2774151 RepID=A0A6M5YFK3_9BACT|nr:hypothetical protein [Frigoriglobus tundricola]QJW92787.1 hypothetical protein FTUN_0284 [Frigoriglobus tundricola]
MARAMQARIVLGISFFSVLAASGPVRAGLISVVLTAGEGGSTATASSGKFQFTSPSTSALVTVNQMVGIGSVQATTGGGVSFFGPTGVPMLLNVADGSAYLASSGAPSGAVPSTGLASASPQPIAAPAGSALLNVTETANANGTESLAVSVTDQNGNVLGSGKIDVPGTGWWVLGLTPGSASSTPPSTPSSPGSPSNPSPPATNATPEPATLALAVIGLPLAGAVRLFRRKVS